MNPLPSGPGQPRLTVLVMDHPGRHYFELPEHLDVDFTSRLNLPAAVPLLIWAGDVQTADPLALLSLAAATANRWCGFLRLPLWESWALELLQLRAGFCTEEAA